MPHNWKCNFVLHLYRCPEGDRLDRSWLVSVNMPCPVCFLPYCWHNFCHDNTGYFHSNPHCKPCANVLCLSSSQQDQPRCKHSSIPTAFTCFAARKESGTGHGSYQLTSLPFTRTNTFEQNQRVFIPKNVRCFAAMGYNDGVSNIFRESYRIHSKDQIHQRRHEDCLIIAFDEHWQLISFPASKNVLLLDYLRTHFLVRTLKMIDSKQYVWTHCWVLCCYICVFYTVNLDL